MTSASASCCRASAMVCRMICWWPRCTPSKKPMARQTFWSPDCSSFAACISRIGLMGRIGPIGRMLAGPSRSRQLQKRDHALFQVRLGEFQDLLQPNGFGEVEFSRHRPPQGGEVGATAEFLSKFMSEAANISPLRAGNAKLSERFLVVRESKRINMNQPRLARHFHAFTRQLVKRNAVLLDR